MMANQKQQKLPQHVAFIMDGNGTYGENTGHDRSYGHEAGAEKVREVISYMRDRRIPYVTLYAFSTENWKRPKWEIQVIMRLLRKFSQKEINNFLKNDIRVKFIGRRDRLGRGLLQAMNDLESATNECKSMLLQVAVDYGSRDEILRAINNVIKAGNSVTEEEFSALLDTSLAPDPDLVIRTSGQYRLSNFMLWQSAYTEWQFTNTKWPELTTEEIESILEKYMGIDRRFGAINTAAE